MPRFLLGFLLVFSSAAAQAPRPAGRQPYILQPSTRAAFGQARKLHPVVPLLKETQAITRKTNNTLTLPLENGKERRFLDDTPVGEPSLRVHTYLGEMVALPKYLLGVEAEESWVAYPEPSVMLLVDQRTGAVDTVATEPIISPGNTKVAALENRWDVSEVDNGVWLYNVVQGRVKRDFFLPQPDDIPCSLVWVDDRTFILRTFKIATALEMGMPPDTASDEDGKYTFNYWLVTLR